MKIFLKCLECSTAHLTNAPNPPPKVETETRAYEIDANGLANGTCPAGHSFSVLVQASQFEILFDWACLALLDGYYREAIASFGTSVERFHEFALRVICRARGINLEGEPFKTAWKDVEGASERQYGAFLFVSLIETGKAETIPQSLSKQRNGVVHRGAYADKAGAFDYGEYCYTRIWGVQRQLRERYREAFDKQKSVDFTEKASKRERRPGVSPVTVALGVSPLSTVNEKHTFREELESFDYHNHWRPPHPAVVTIDVSSEQ